MEEDKQANRRGARNLKDQLTATTQSLAVLFTHLPQIIDTTNHPKKKSYQKQQPDQ